MTTYARIPRLPIVKLAYSHIADTHKQCLLKKSIPTTDEAENNLQQRTMQLIVTDEFDHFNWQHHSLRGLSLHQIWM